MVGKFADSNDLNSEEIEVYEIYSGYQIYWLKYMHDTRDSVCDSGVLYDYTYGDNEERYAHLELLPLYYSTCLHMMENC